MSTLPQARLRPTPKVIGIKGTLIPQIQCIAHNAEIFSAAIAKPYSDPDLNLSSEQVEILNKAIADLETAATHLRSILGAR